MEVQLEDGQRMIVPASHVSGAPGGPYRFDSSFSALRSASGSAETDGLVFPVIEEEIQISKRKFEKERVKVVTHVSQHEEVVDVPVVHEEIEVTRVAVGRVVEAAELPRQEGDTLVVPVYDEVLVVEKRLVLREEVRLKRTRREQVDSQRVTLRREDVQVERKTLDPTPQGRS